MALQAASDPTSLVGTGDTPLKVLTAGPWTSTAAPSTTLAIGYSAIARQVRELRGEHSALAPRIAAAGDEAYRDEWSMRTKNISKQTVPDVLNSLADRGFAWRDVARLVGVSVPAVSKWRRGEPVTAANAHRVYGLVAMCSLLEEHFDVQDVATWFEVPLSVDAPITPADLWTLDRLDLLWQAAEDDVSGESVLDQLDPQWRERYRSDFETFRSSDGALSIRPRAR